MLPKVDLRPAPPRRAGGACESSAPPRHRHVRCHVDVRMWADSPQTRRLQVHTFMTHSFLELGAAVCCGVGPAGVFVDQNCAALYGYVRLLGADDGTSAILKRKRRLFDHRWQCEENKRK